VARSEQHVTRIEWRAAWPSGAQGPHWRLYAAACGAPTRGAPGFRLKKNAGVAEAGVAQITFAKHYLGVFRNTLTKCTK